jgi:hypothetical protein
MWFGNMPTSREYSYISVYDLELCHNIFIVKFHCMDKYEKLKNIMCRTAGGTVTTYSSPSQHKLKLCLMG